MSVSTLKRTAPTADSRAFKSAMRHLAAGVSVVTSRGEGRINGMTATAVCSVSADPPSVLVVVNRSSHSHGLIAESGAFALNVLGEAQADLAVYFSGSEAKCFEAIPHRYGVTGCPILAVCCASMECRVESRCDFGTHTIFVGQVVTVNDRDEMPLIYFDARFHGLGAERRQ